MTIDVSCDLRAAAARDLILAVGAMALLMLGVLPPASEPAGIDRVGSRSLVLVGAGSSCSQPRRRRRSLFDGALRRRRLRPLHEGAGAGRRRASRCCCRSTTARARAARTFEYPGAGRCSPPLGMMMMVSANDLIALYLGLELQSLALYVRRRLSTATTCARPKRASSISCSARCRRACCSTAPR